MMTARRRARIEAATRAHVAAIRQVGRRPIREQVDAMAAAGDRQWQAWLTYWRNIAFTGSLR